jgi:quercetin dioxygenase-like cupin family protein
MELDVIEPSTFEVCYPEGLPEGFPVDLFAPINGAALAIREQKLKDKIDDLQAFMLEQPQADIPVRNVFSGGVYAREVFIPKGTMLVGKVHMTEHLNICLKGDLTFLSVDGPKRIKAPAMFSSPAGTKKLAYANEDSIWVNVHPDLGTDADTIVDAITVNTFAEYDKLVGKASFTQAIEHFGFTEYSVRKASEDESTLDRTPLVGVEVRPSSIEGQGLFATQSYASGQILCPATLNNKRSLAGRYSNHSVAPNCMFDYVDNILVLVALRDIESDEELTTDYGTTLAAIASRNKE